MEISEITELQEVPDNKSFDKWANDHTEGIEDNLELFHKVFLEIKSEMSNKISEINADKQMNVYY